MKKIKDKNLIKLGFKKEHNVPIKIGNYVEKFHYFVYDINERSLLISSDNIESEANDGYYVEFYDVPNIRFTNLKDLKKLVKLLKKASV